MANWSESDSEPFTDSDRDGSESDSGGNWEGRVESTPFLDSLEQNNAIQRDQADQYYSQRRRPIVTIIEQSTDEPKQYRAALNKLQYAYFTHLIQSEPEKHFANPDIVAYYKGKAEQAVKKPTVGVLITLNFDPKLFDFSDRVQLDHVNLCLKRALTKCWVAKWMYAWEQRGRTDEEIGTGVHLNVAIQFGEPNQRKPSQVQSEFHNNFQAWLPKPAVHVVSYKDMTNAYNYTKGIKADPDKQALVELDKKWRKAVGLLDCYSSS